MHTNHPHLTAKERNKISFPTNWLYRHNFLKGDILDFGCGLGADVKGLKDFVNIIGYDPYHNNTYPKQTFDTIICQYVFNVLEIEHQEKLLLEITSLLSPNGKAYITIRRDIKYEGYRIHKIHKKTTYQRNVILPFPSIFNNDFCEIYQIERKADKPSKDACIFCRPSNKLEYIAESSNTLAIFDAYPVSQGHALIVPKVHVADFFDLKKSIQNELWETVSFVKNILQKNFNPDGFNVGININKAAGQTVFHCHIHIIPRYTGDVKNPRGGIRHVIPEKGFY